MRGGHRLIENEGSWGRRLLVLLFLGLLIALPATWISSQYLGKSVNAILSYNVNDGWCEAGVFPGLGAHCFGDYTQSALVAEHDFQLSDRNFAKEGPYLSDPTVAYNALYPPVSQFPHVMVSLVRLHLLSPDVTFYLYASLLALAMLLPAIWVAWGWRSSPFALAPILLIGIASLPLFAMIDRGNSAGFVVPLLLAFAVFLGRDPRWVAPVAVVGAALVRPQFIVLVIGLAAIGRLRQAIAAVGVFLAMTLASFALTPAGFSSSFSAWRESVAGFKGGFGDLTWSMPANISVARATVATGQALGDLPGPIGAFGRWLIGAVMANPLGPSLLLCALALAILYLARTSVPRSVAVVIPLMLATTFPAVVPGYYLGFAIVIAALILGRSLTSRGPGPGMLDESPAPWYWGWPLVIVTALSLAPLPFVRDTDPGLPLTRNSIALEWIGRLWVAVVILGLIWVLIRQARAQRATTPGALPPAV